MKHKFLLPFICIFTFTVIGIKKVQSQSCQSYTYPTTLSRLTASLPSGNYYINSNISISTNISITDAEILMAPGTSITVQNGGVLNIFGSHLYACKDMWQGIMVENGGQLIIDQGTTHDNSLIEDADIAVQLQHDYDNSNLFGADVLNINNTIFNRNRIGIDFGQSRYEGGNSSLYPRYYPITIKNFIFTCRDIPFTSGSGVWVHFSTFKNTTLSSGTSYPETPGSSSSPYIEETQFSAFNQEAFLKSPYQNTKSAIGINFGYDSYVGAHHNGIYKIGEETNTVNTNNVTIFDNQTIGVKMVSTDVKFVNCTYQNTPSANPNLETYGILAEHYDEANFYLDIRAAAGTPHNAFFDCKYAITSKFYTQVHVEQTDVRSSKTAPLASVREGYEGVNISTSSYGWDNYNNSIYVSNNEIVNIAYPITVRYDDLPWFAAIGTPSGVNPELTNTIEVNSNWIALQPLDYAYHSEPGNFIEQAINLEVVVPSVSSIIIYPPLRCNNNVIYGVHHAIRLSKWEGKDVRVLNNIASIGVPATTPYTIPIGHSGIDIVGCIPQQSAANFVYGNVVARQDGAPVTNFNNGIGVSNGSDFTMRCNLVGGAFRAMYQFAGVLNNTIFFNNEMYQEPGTYHGWGLALNNAIIGQQGNSSIACDNFYDNTNPWGTGYKTIAINSDATQSPMYVQLGNILYDPTGYNGLIGTGFPYVTANSSLLQGQANNYGCPAIANRAVLDENGNIRPGIKPDTTTVDESKIALNDATIENKKIAEAEQIAIGHTMQNRSTEPDLRLYVAQMELYQILTASNKWIQKGATLQQFVQANKNASFGIINDISKNVLKGDTALALRQLAAWKKTNRVDENYAQFLYWTIYRRQHQLLDTIAIIALATRCPQTDGNVVYAAQNLYNAITNKHRVFITDCDVELEADKQSREILTTKNQQIFIENSVANAVDIYPNPANNVVFIKGENIKKIELLNVLGVVIQTKFGVQGINNISMENANAGLYIVKITNKQKMVTVRKIVKQ